MLGQVRAPLVSGGVPARIRGNYSYWLVPLTAGLLAGSALTSVVVAAIGSLAGVSAWPASTRTLILAVALAVFLFFDGYAFRRGTVSRLGLSRQTPQRLKYATRRSLLAFGWGMDIGTGVSTFRVTSAIWLVSLALALGLVPVYIGLMYGVGLALLLAIAIVSGIVGPAVEVWMARIMTGRRWLQGVNIVLLLSLGSVLLLA
jgi:hypothetical protein